MKKIYTVLDARRAEADEQGWQDAADNKAAELKAAEQELLQKHPQIGVLCREGKTVYYVYPAGGLYQEGTLEHLAGVLDRETSSEIGERNRRLMFGENEEAFPGDAEWSMIVD